MSSAAPGNGGRNRPGMGWEWGQEQAREGLGMRPGIGRGWAGNGARNRPGIGWEWGQE